ncbi:MAG: hypothetical protein ACPLX8_02035 [Nanopusillaceae archaeon]
MDKPKNLIFISVLISVLSFLLGLLSGYLFYQYSFQQGLSQLNKITAITISAQYLAESKNFECSEDYLSFLQYLKSQIAQIGLELEYLESVGNIYYNKGQVEYIKSQYFNLEYLHFILTKRFIEECNYSNFTLILYFYNNVYCGEECYRQGNVLTYLYNKYEKTLYIYSFDSSYPNYFINYYDVKYNITKWPAIIMYRQNKTYFFSGFTNLSTLESYLTS